MGKRKYIKPLTWSQLWTKLRKLGWRFERQKGLSTENRFFTPAGWEERPNDTHLVDYFDSADEVWQHLSVEVLYDGASPTKRPTPQPTRAETPTPSPANSPTANPPAKAPTNSLAEKPPAKAHPKAPTKSPSEPSAIAPSKSTSKSPANSPAKPPAKAPAKSPAKTTPKKRARKASPSTPVSSSTESPTRAPTTRFGGGHPESVDISVGNDQMDSGDEDDDYCVDDDEGESEVEDTSGSYASEDKSTSDEEDAVDLSAGTPFDKLTKEQLSESAQTGWTTYFEADSAYRSVLYRILPF
ncbi:hypothetical protein DVH05_013263 [Phytophthora capsici]|nr:hypothetical protein DVH05_013263 [Phytophthora capsici]